jgi:hypothetical protein
MQTICIFNEDYLQTSCTLCADYETCDFGGADPAADPAQLVTWVALIRQI